MHFSLKIGFRLKQCSKFKTLFTLYDGSCIPIGQLKYFNNVGYCSYFIEVFITWILNISVFLRNYTNNAFALIKFLYQADGFIAAHRYRDYNTGK